MFGMTSNDIGIDLGTASILVYIKGKGVVLKEPSVVAIERDSGRILAIGEEARLMIGRTPGNIIAIRPLRHGVISDYTVTEKMLKYFINKAVGKKTLLRPRIAVCIISISSCRLKPNNDARTTLLKTLETALSPITRSIVLLLSRFACRQLP